MPSVLRFRVLGPLVMERDGTAVPLRGPKARGLLALLLLRAGDTMSQDLLVDAVWGERPPPSARTALQMHVSRLRKLLADDPTAGIETEGSSYRLRIEPERLDARRFRDLIEAGRSKLASRDYEAARETIGGALELWRGEPLSDVDIPGLPRAELAELRELRLTALVARIETDLALGLHPTILPEMEALRLEYPLDERLHALSAIALYRAGRQGDALEVIARLRRTLAEELGLDLGAEIADLEQRILNQDESLTYVAREPEPTREGRKTVTALVCRIGVDRAEGEDPEARQVRVAPLLEDARQIVLLHGGTIRRAVGSRIVAIFGSPQVHEDDAARALRAAEALHVRMGADAPADPASGLGFRTGIATGEVMVEGRGGHEELLTADPLDAADGLCLAAKSGEILLDRTSARLARQFAREPEGLLLLGDGSAPSMAFQLKAGGGSAHEAPRLRSPLVGRSEELALLHGSLARVLHARKASLVSIIGPPGVGKSRLVAEFLDATHLDAQALIGRCLSYGKDITFWPIAEIVRQGSGIGEAELVADAMAKIAQTLQGAPEPEFIGEQLATVLGISEAAPVPDEIFWSIRMYLETVASKRPLVVVFEDLHWGEETLLDLIEHLAAWTKEAVLFICTARPELVERRPGWGGGKLDAATLNLEALGPEDSSLLIDNLLGRADLERGTRRRILEVAEGNPLFVEELLAMLIEEGGLTWREGRWAADEGIGQIPLPPTVQALLEARLDRLPSDERNLLEDASVVGREFTQDDLAAFGWTAEQTGDLLDSLAARDLLTHGPRHRPGGLAFRFRHVLLREVAYQGMPRSARASAHQAFGEHLEQRRSERIGEIEEIIGYQYEAAHRLLAEIGIRDESTPSLAERSADRLTPASRRALAREDMPAAASLAARALALVPADDRRRPELSWVQGVALFELGRLAEAESALDAGLEAAERLHQDAMAWRLRLERTELHFWRDPESLDTHAIEQLARDAVPALEAAGDLSGTARAYRLMGDAIHRRGKLEEAYESFEQARVLALRAGDEREANQRPALGVVHGPLPADRCIEILRRSLEQARRPNPDGLAGLGLMLATTGDLEQAAATFSDALRRAHELGAGWKIASINMHRGAALLVADDPVGAEEALRPAVEQLQSMGERSMMSTAVALLAEALFRLDRLDEAMLATIVSEGATAPDDLASQMAWRGVRAKVLAARGDIREAERLAREGAAFADESDLLNMAADAHLDLAAVLRTAGRAAEAAEEAARAMNLYERKGNRVSLDRARARAVSAR